MRRKTPPFEDAVEAFREVTAAPADGAATRARILGRAGADGTRARVRRRAWLSIGALVTVCSSASVAWTLAGEGRVPVRTSTIETEPPWHVLGVSARPLRVIPSEQVERGSEAPHLGPPEADREQSDYRRAHEAHFGAGDPARAVHLWDVYLSAHPSGRFAPEARFNRVLDLVRLSRFEEAERALRPFADGPLGGYRQHDAAVLLDWLAAGRRADGTPWLPPRGAGQKSKPPESE